MQSKKDEVISHLKDKNFKIYFYLPEDNGQILLSQWEILKHAKVLHDKNYDVTIILDNIDNEKREMPYWVSKDFKNLPQVLLSDLTKKSVGVSVKDFIVVPELFTYFLQQIKELPAKNIMFVQSLDALMRGMNNPTIKFLRDFNVDTFIGTSNVITDFMLQNYAIESKYFDVYKIEPTIPQYFKCDYEYVKKPKIALFGKNHNELKNIVNIFMNRYPHLSWVSFEGLGNLSREEFASKLKEYVCAVWSDTSSTFGTFPIECAMAKTFCIAKRPKYLPNHLKNQYGLFLCENYISNKDENGQHNDMVEVLHDVFTKYLESTKSDIKKYFDQCENLIFNYEESKENDSKILEVYESIVEKRIEDFKNLG